MLEMKYTPHSIRYPPRAPRLCFCRQTNWWAVVWLVQCKWVSRFETFGQICCDINLRAILQSTSVHKLLAENTKMRTVNTTVSFSILVVSLSSMFRTSVVRRTSSRNMLARFHCFAAVASRRQTKSLLRTGGKTKKWGKNHKKNKNRYEFLFYGQNQQFWVQRWWVYFHCFVWLWAAVGDDAYLSLVICSVRSLWPWPKRLKLGQVPSLSVACLKWTAGSLVCTYKPSAARHPCDLATQLTHIILQ